MKARLRSLEEKIELQVEENKNLLSKLRQIQEDDRRTLKTGKREEALPQIGPGGVEDGREPVGEGGQEQVGEGGQEQAEEDASAAKPVIPVLLFACNR